MTTHIKLGPEKFVHQRVRSLSAKDSEHLQSDVQKMPLAVAAYKNGVALNTAYKMLQIALSQKQPRQRRQIGLEASFDRHR